MAASNLYQGHRNSYTELNEVNFWTITKKDWIHIFRRGWCFLSPNFRIPSYLERPGVVFSLSPADNQPVPVSHSDYLNNVRSCLVIDHACVKLISFKK